MINFDTKKFFSQDNIDLILKQINSEALKMSFNISSSDNRTSRMKFLNSYKGLLIEEIHNFIIKDLGYDFFIDKYKTNSNFNSDMFDIITLKGLTIDIKSFQSSNNENNSLNDSTTKNIKKSWADKRLVDIYTVMEMPDFKDLYNYYDEKNGLNNKFVIEKIKNLTFLGFIYYRNFRNNLSKYLKYGTEPEVFFYISDLNDDFSSYLSLFEKNEKFTFVNSIQVENVSLDYESNYDFILNNWYKTTYYKKSNFDLYGEYFLSYFYDKKSNQIINFVNDGNIDWQVLYKNVLKLIVKTSSHEIIINLKNIPYKALDKDEFILNLNDILLKYNKTINFVNDDNIIKHTNDYIYYKTVVYIRNNNDIKKLIEKCDNTFYMQTYMIINNMNKIKHNRIDNLNLYDFKDTLFILERDYLYNTITPNKIYLPNNIKADNLLVLNSNNNINVKSNNFKNILYD